MNRPPIKDVTLMKSGQFSNSWVFWFQEAYRLLNGQRPFPLQSFTVATLPTASDYPNCLVYVSNETGGAVPAFSDGTDWLRVTDRTIVS